MDIEIGGKLRILDTDNVGMVPRHYLRITINFSEEKDSTSAIDLC